MTLFKRGRVWWSGFSMEGRRYQFSTGTANRRKAEQIEHKLKEEANLQQFQITVQDPSLTFQDLVDAFEEKGNAKFFHKDRLKHLLPFFGTMRVIQITKNSVLEYRNSRKREKEMLKDATVNRDISVLRRIIYWAKDEGLIRESPLGRITMVRERRTKKPVMSVAHETAILTVAKPHLRELVIAGLDTGMRKGELLQQQWGDVDLERKIISVTRSKTPEGDAREIPMSARLYELLRARACPSGPVFIFNKKAIGHIKRSWTTAQMDARIPVHYRFHDMRHSFATRLMEAGVVQDVRMALMGHEPQTVHWGYTHVELPAKREAIQKLEAWIAQQKAAASTKS
jgi:integrase